MASTGAWHPATCACVVEMEGSEATGWTVTRMLNHCPAHSSIAKAALAAELIAEAREWNAARMAFIESFPRHCGDFYRRRVGDNVEEVVLAPGAPAPAGYQFVETRPLDGMFEARYSGNGPRRALTIFAPALTITERASLAVAAPAKLAAWMPRSVTGRVVTVE